MLSITRDPSSSYALPLRPCRQSATPWAQPVLRGGQWSQAVRLAFELKQPRKLFGVLTEMLDTGVKVPHVPCAALPRGFCGRASVTVFVAGVWDYAPLPSGSRGVGSCPQLPTAALLKQAARKSIRSFCRPSSRASCRRRVGILPPPGLDIRTSLSDHKARARHS